MKKDFENKLWKRVNKFRLEKERNEMMRCR